MENQNLYRKLALSKNPLAQGLRKLYYLQFSLSLPPLPKLVYWVPARLFVALRALYFSLKRILFAEPYFRSYCTKIGKNFHTGAHPHWVAGVGDIEVGDNVTIDGRCSFFFALRYSEKPVIRIGNNTGIGHNCAFTVGKSITIGDHCRIGGFVTMFDTPGHPIAAQPRLEGQPAMDGEVKPVEIGNNVWLGTMSTIFPGVKIGDNSVVAYGSIVMSDVPANVVVAGNPARQIAKVPSGETVPGQQG